MVVLYMNRKFIIRELHEYFKKQDKVSMAFLFRSWATGDAGIDSDIDIAIYFKPANNIME